MNRYDNSRSVKTDSISLRTRLFDFCYLANIRHHCVLFTHPWQMNEIKYAQKQFIKLLCVSSWWYCLFSKLGSSLSTTKRKALTFLFIPRVPFCFPCHIKKSTRTISIDIPYIRLLEEGIELKLVIVGDARRKCFRFCCHNMYIRKIKLWANWKAKASVWEYIHSMQRLKIKQCNLMNRMSPKQA